MADLYTSLSRAKQILMATRDWRGDGPPPPPVAMTPVPESVQNIIRPEYTIGMGALRECGDTGFGCPECRAGVCQNRGLQCPVCGEWKHRLTRHLNGVHGDIGGRRGVCKLLSMPPSLKLVSRHESERMRTANTLDAAKARQARRPLSSQQAKQMRAARITHRDTIAEANQKNTCPAQVRQRLMTLQERLGRSPTFSEAERLDPGLATAAIIVHGTWNNAKVQTGLHTFRRGASFAYKQEAVREALRAWVEVHGDLPTKREARRPTRTPLIPSTTAILRAFGTESWTAAMEQASVELRLWNGRYAPARHLTAA
jgi:hypothetical protein